MTLSELIENLSMLAEAKPKTIFIPEGLHQGYLRGSVAKQLGWRR